MPEIKPYPWENIADIKYGQTYTLEKGFFAEYTAHFNMEGLKPKPKKKKEVIAPAGYHLINDENYIIKEGDKYYIGCWNDYTFVGLDNFLGKILGYTLKELMNQFKNKGGFYIASKEPRFKCEKGYPHGY